MKLSNSKKFLLIIGLQALVIVGIVCLRFIMFGNATEVLLKINPVDPTDPLRGDYIVFNYDIGELDSSLAEDLSDSKEGDKVYVVLEEGSELIDVEQSIVSVNKASKITLNKPKKGDLFIEGSLKNFDPLRFPNTENGNQILSLNLINIEYGIEQYFIPERSGRNLLFENTSRVYAKVRINDEGRAQIEKIYKDGNEWPPKK